MMHVVHADKRQHKKKDFDDLEQFSKTNPTQMWTKFKLLYDPPSTRAALEIVRADGSISNDIKEILLRVPPIRESRVGHIMLQ